MINRKVPPSTVAPVAHQSQVDPDAFWQNRDRPATLKMLQKAVDQGQRACFVSREASFTVQQANGGYYGIGDDAGYMVLRRTWLGVLDEVGVWASNYGWYVEEVAR